MHRTIEIAVPPERTDALVRELQDLEHVIGLSLRRGASVKPPGDLVTVHTLNRGADAVLRAVGRAQERGPVSVATAQLTSLTDLRHQHAIDRDVDEAVWEELETGLRHQGRVTPNFLILMALGGAIATAGLVSGPVTQAIAFVAAAVIAPGFEPVAKIPLGLVLRRWEVLRLGLVATLLGYAALIGAAAASFLLLQFLDEATLGKILANPAVEHLAHPSEADLLVSACGALAGVTIVAAYRRSVIAGALMAMRLIDAAAVIGVALAAGELWLVREGLERLAIDVAFVVAAGVLVFWAKQRLVHRRAPLH